jgi:hypothetical protein
VLFHVVLQDVRFAACEPGRIHTSAGSQTSRNSSFRNFIFAFILFTVLVSPLAVSAQAAPVLAPVPATQSGVFTDSIGVVTHLSYTDTLYYTDFPAIAQELQTLGVHHIRDGYYPWAQSSPIVQAHQQLASMGIKCTYVIPYQSLSSHAQTVQMVGQITSFSHEVGDMEAVEPPNECDVSGECNGYGTPAIKNEIGFLGVVFDSGFSLNVPYLGPSFVLPQSYPTAGNLSSQMTINNLHVYFGGRNPGSTGWGDFDPQGNSYGSFNYWLDQAAIDGPGRSSEITETGYLTYPSTSTPYTVPESVEASYTPRTLLLAYEHGFKRTFLYELLDEVSSPGYGLLRADMSPRPAFTAVQNLISILSDTTTVFTPKPLSYAITGGDSTLNQVLLEKRDGSYWLVLWLEKSSWNADTATPIAVAPEQATLTLNSTYSAEQVYQFNTQGTYTTSAPATVTNNAAKTHTTSFPVSDQITIVHIVP